MLRKVLPIICLLLLVFQFGILDIHAQDYSQWELPDGVIARLGKGRINDMQYSPDGSILAVATTVGIWLYDTDTYQEQKLFTRSHQEMEKVYFENDGTVLVGIERFRDKITRWDVTLEKKGQSSINEHGFSRQPPLYSSDGSTYLSKTYKEIHIHDSKTNSTKYILRGHVDRIGCLAYSPDGQIIASGSNDQTVRLWDVKTGKPIRTLAGHKDDIISLLFSPNGNTLISVSKNMTVNFWDIASGELKLPLVIAGVISDKSFQKEKVKRTFFSQDKSQLVTVGEYRTIHLWDTLTGELKQTLSEPEDDIKKTGYIKDVENILFSPDGETIVSLVSDYQIRMWDMKTGERKHFTGDTGYLTNATYSPDGMTLTTADFPGVIRIWDITTGKLKKTISCIDPWDNYGRQQYNPYYIALSPNNEKAFISESSGVLSMWDTSAKRLRPLMERQDGSKSTWAQNVLLSPDGKTVVNWSRSEDWLIRFWNAETGEHKRTIKDRKGPINRVVFSMDSSTLASWGYFDGDNKIRLWNVATGRHTKTLTGHNSGIERVIFSPDGETLISGSRDGTILIFDVSTGKLKETLTDQGIDPESDTHPNSIMVLMFNSDGSRLATGDKKGNISLCDVSTWKEIQTLDGHADAITSIGFSPDDRLIASTGEDGTVRLWDIDTGQQIQSISGDRRVVWYVMFYPNGLALATEYGGMNSRHHPAIINLWDLRTGERINTLAGHSGPIQGLSFSDDGKTLASTSFDNTILLWDLTPIVSEFDVE